MPNSILQNWLVKWYLHSFIYYKLIDVGCLTPSHVKVLDISSVGHEGTR